jgi:hypothetical protein
LRWKFAPVVDTDKEPNQKVLLKLIELLAERVAKGPVEPVRLSKQQEREIRDRVKMGERASNIAIAYRCDIDTVKWIGQRSREL